MALRRPYHFTGKTAAVAGIVEPHIIDGPAGIAQFFGEVSHGGQDQDDLALVMPHIGGLFVDLHHQHDGRRRIGALQGCQLVRKLIAEDGDKQHHEGAAIPTRP